ncbi:MAG: thiamine pyrophosphate-binding protein [Dehalococcoidia bacterium]|nr:thiamine pyrophosphate-binding protein [Dehalococcoidia bacterium]
MAELSGAQIIARSLRQQGVDHMFGIVGIPVVPIAMAFQKEGGKFYGFRNEQAASYAAAAVGYLTGRPGAALGVSGPGMIHAVAGMANAWSNCWPMILLGGANDSYQNGQGAFQEAPQIETARPYAKYAARPDSTQRLPYYIEQAVRTSIYGRPGAVYIDLPGDIITGTVDEAELEFPAKCPEPPRTQAPQEDVENALAALKSAERPLVIVGKGAAYSRAEDEVREFIETTQLPFLPSPMGKGVIPDDHPLSVAPARSYALQNADLVFLMGARFNWILHFGHPPRFDKKVRVVQMDVNSEEIGTNVPTEVPLVGDAKAITKQLNTALKQNPWQYPAETTWRSGLKNKFEENSQAVQAMEADNGEPMGYYHVLGAIRDAIPRNAILSNEGASTMDIGRTVFPAFEARQRLDAASFGTMGVGLAQAIAAAAVYPDRKIVCVEGDSAFGFSGMEVETAARYGLNITFIIVNNNGVGGGPSELPPDPTKAPVGAYTPSAHYEKMAENLRRQGLLRNHGRGAGANAEGSAELRQAEHREHHDRPQGAAEAAAVRLADALTAGPAVHHQRGVHRAPRFHLLRRPALELLEVGEVEVFQVIEPREGIQVDAGGAGRGARASGIESGKGRWRAGHGRLVILGFDVHLEHGVFVEAWRG